MVDFFMDCLPYVLLLICAAPMCGPLTGRRWSGPARHIRRIARPVPKGLARHADVLEAGRDAVALRAFRKFILVDRWLVRAGDCDGMEQAGCSRNSRERMPGAKLDELRPDWRAGMPPRTGLRNDRCAEPEPARKASVLTQSPPVTRQFDPGHTSHHRARTLPRAWRRKDRGQVSAIRLRRDWKWRFGPLPDGCKPALPGPARTTAATAARALDVLARARRAGRHASRRILSLENVEDSPVSPASGGSCGRATSGP